MTSIPTSKVGGRWGVCARRGAAPRTSAAETVRSFMSGSGLPGGPGLGADPHLHPRARHLHLDLAVLQLGEGGVGQTVLAAKLGGELPKGGVQPHEREGGLVEAAGPLREVSQDVVVVAPVLEVGLPLLDLDGREEARVLLGLRDHPESVAAAELHSTAVTAPTPGRSPSPLFRSAEASTKASSLLLP